MTTDPRHEAPEPEPEPDEGDGEDEGAARSAAVNPDAATPPAEIDEAEGEPEAPLCPLCNGQGVLSVQPLPSRGWERCDECDGWGQVYTGSRLPEAALIDCESCGGKGYKVKAQPPPEYVSPDTPGAEYDAATGTWVLRHPAPIAAPAA